MSAPVSALRRDFTDSRITAVVATVTVPTGLFVDGRWVDTADRFSVEDPSTGTPLATVSSASVDHSLAALDAAHRAQPEWGTTSPRHRADVLHRAFELLVERTEAFATVISAEMGKPLAEARGEVAYGAEFFRWFAEQTAHVRGDYGPAPSGGFRVVTTKRPVGPSYLVIPWNFPLAMGTRKIGAALAAGCTVLLKPAPQTPLTSALLIEVLDEAGVPPGVVNLVTTNDSRSQSSALMADSRLRKVSFTGSTQTGSTLLRQAADTVLRTSMELGGNGPFLVLDDADIEAAVEGAMLAKFRNGGESCVAANRFLVHRDAADEFTARFVARVRDLRPGPGLSDGSTIGPLIDEVALAKVEGLVAQAVDEGAAVAVGGRRLARSGHFFEPTVLTGVKPTSTIANTEIFGPVAPITVVDSNDEAVDLANDTPYGLAAFVYTRDIAKALDVGERLEAGMVGINRGLVSEAGAPFGGVKQSGLGREGGDVGIDEYLETRYLAVGLV